MIMHTGVGQRLGIDFTTQDLYDFLGTEPDAYLEKPVDPMFLRQIADRLSMHARSTTMRDGACVYAQRRYRRRPADRLTF